MSSTTNPANIVTPSRNGTHTPSGVCVTPETMDAPTRPGSNAESRTAHHPFPRLREGAESQNTMERTFAFAPPPLGNGASEEIERMCQYIEQHEPLRAHDIRKGKYDLFQAHTILDEQCRESARGVQAAFEKREQDTKADRALVDRYTEEKRHWDHVNHACFARVHVCYDHENPSDTELLHVEHRSSGYAAANLKLPYSEQEARPSMPPWVDFVTTGAVGSAVGLGAGILWKILPAEQLDRSPGAVAACLAVGIAITFAAKYAIHKSASFASRLYWSERPAWQWGPALALAISVPLCVMGIDAATQHQGFLAWQEAQAGLLDRLSHASSNATEPVGSISTTLLFVAALLTTFGYVIANALAGERRGRHEACCNRLDAWIVDDYEKRQEQRRNDREVREALQGLNRVREVMRWKAEAEARIKSAEEAYKFEVTRLNQLIQDRHDDLIGQQRLFDAKLTKAREECDAFPHLDDSDSKGGE